MAKTVFEKVIAREFEGSFVYEDDVCAAFMDLHPQNPGHILVVPKEPIERLSSLPEATAMHLMKVAKQLVSALERSEIKCEGANLFLSDGEIAGQEVTHVHLHIVPRFQNDGLKLSFGKPFKKESRAKLNRVASLISEAIK